MKTLIVLLLVLASSHLSGGCSNMTSPDESYGRYACSEFQFKGDVNDSEVREDILRHATGKALKHHKSIRELNYNKDTLVMKERERKHKTSQMEEFADQQQKYQQDDAMIKQLREAGFRDFY